MVERVSASDEALRETRYCQRVTVNEWDQIPNAYVAAELLQERRNVVYWKITDRHSGEVPEFIYFHVSFL